MTKQAPARRVKRGEHAVRWLSGERLRDRRKAAGLTQAQLADKCGNGVTQNRIGHWEIGSWGCDLETVVALAEALPDCTPSDLMHDEACQTFAKLTLAYGKREMFANPVRPTAA